MKIALRFLYAILLVAGLAYGVHAIITMFEQNQLASCAYTHDKTACGEILENSDSYWVKSEKQEICLNKRASTEAPFLCVYDFDLRKGMERSQHLRGNEFEEWKASLQQL